MPGFRFPASLSQHVMHIGGAELEPCCGRELNLVTVL
jgi:hypothetical protein